MTILTFTTFLIIAISNTEALTCFTCEKQTRENGDIISEIDGCLEQEAAEVCEPGKVCVQGNYEYSVRGKKRIYEYYKGCDAACDESEMCNEKWCETDFCNTMSSEGLQMYVYGQEEETEEEEEGEGQDESQDDKQDEDPEEDTEENGDEGADVDEEVNGDESTIEDEAEDTDEDNSEDTNEDENGEDKEQSEEGGNADEETQDSEPNGGENGEENGEENEGENGTYIVDENEQDQSSDQSNDETLEETELDNRGFSVVLNTVLALAALSALLSM